TDEELVMIDAAFGDVVKTQTWLASFAADEDEVNAIVTKMYDDCVALGLETLQEAGRETFEAAKATAEKYQ
ncbi:MAG: hypothetical protein IJ048_04805, partial [Clostridia bacterium]|nr:hypothetical protein [Clostridia bacterium]